MRIFEKRKKLFGRILGILIFWMIFLLVFGRVSEIFRTKVAGNTDMVHSFYELDKNSLDVLILGSSHGFCSFLPNLLWQEEGMTSYVMGSYRQTAAESYWLLREALKYQSPKVLIMEGYYFFSDRKYTDDAALRSCCDGMPLSKLKYDMIMDLGDRMSIKTKLTYFVPFLKYHSRWSELKDVDFNRDAWSQGALISDEVTKVLTPELPTEPEEVPSVFYDYFERIADLCEEKGIELVVYIAPFTYHSDTKDDRDLYFSAQAKYLELEGYMAEKGIPYFYYQRTDEPGVDYSKDFLDYSHLNTSGAIKVTRTLARYLRENYDLQDHRGDEAYASWDADSKQFRKWAKKHGISLK